MTAMHRVQRAEVEVSAFARAVSLKRAVVTAVAGGFLAFAVSRGWITADLSTQVNSYIADGLTFATAIGTGAWIHFGTTPARQDLKPINSDGQLLVPDPTQPPKGGLLPPTVDLNAASVADLAASLAQLQGAALASAGAVSQHDLAVQQAPAQPDPFMEGGGPPPDVPAAGPALDDSPSGPV